MLSHTYPLIRKSLVAFTPTYLPQGIQRPSFPPILGTGFIVREYGVVITNRHVVDAFKSFYRPPEVNSDDWCVTALYLYIREGEQLEVPLEVTGVGLIENFDGGEPYYGPPQPDLAAVYVKARDLPVVEIDMTTEIHEGIEVGIAGFPMGTYMLTVPGWLHQIGPTLQQGIVSAVLPCPGITPHAFTISMMAQGGVSGSPVFQTDTGMVLGVLCAGLNEMRQLRVLSSAIEYSVPTNISYVVPSHYIAQFLQTLKPQIPHDAQTLDGMLQGTTIVVRSRSEL